MKSDNSEINQQEKKLKPIRPYEPPYYRYLRRAVLISTVCIVIILVCGIIAHFTHKDHKQQTGQDATASGTLSERILSDESANNSQKQATSNEISIFIDDSQEREEKSSIPLVLSDPGKIPVYDGNISITIGDNKPFFTEYEINTIVGEHYSDLDSARRCGMAYAMLDESLMPTEERGSIGQVKPTGWNQEKYPGIVDTDPPYLYNRCHLIAYSLTGENANERNLITGTRYFNAYGMLPYEKTILDYLRDSGGKTLYRVTPYFKGRELIARGVEMEAYSVDDRGTSICFHVFVYNVQPGIVIDYHSGKSRLEYES